MSETNTAMVTWSPAGLISALAEPEKPKYDHGFTEEEVINIKAAFKALEEKIAKWEEVSLEEFKTIVVPHCRIHRTEQFILNPQKEKKVKAPREPKAAKTPREPKAPKPKKLSAKEIKARKENLQRIIMLKAAGRELSSDDAAFLELMNKEMGVEVG